MKEVHVLRLSSILGGIKPADALLILFQRTGIPLPPTRAPSTDLRTTCVLLRIYCMHVGEKWMGHSVFLFSTVPQSELVTWRIKPDDFNKTICLSSLPACLCPSDSFLLLFLTLSCFFVFLPSCVNPAFLFSADKMSPHSATALMESKCRLEVTLSRPTCLAAL